MDPRDLTGKRGEFITSSRLLDFCNKHTPYFNPHLLGEKFPTYDLLVELTGGRLGSPYFFAQIKTTRSGGEGGMLNLKVRLKAKDVRAMVMCPIPTYLIGVDEKAEIAYIVSILGTKQKGISSIPTTYPLNRNNLKVLRDEVRDHWKSLTISSKAKSSTFTF